MKAFGPVGIAVAAAVALATALGFPRADTALLILATLGGSLVAALSGAFVLRTVGRRSLRAHELAVALTGGASVGAGALAASVVMFLSTHDLQVLLVVLLISAGAAVGSALALSAQMGAGIARLAALAQHFDDGGGAPMHDDHDTVAELEGLEAQLRDAQVRLDQSRRRQTALERSRRELVAWVSHDLRSPLASIRAMAEALEDEVVADSESVRRYHHSIRGESEHLAALVDDLFELSRITSGSLELHRVTVSLSDLLSDAVALAAPSAEVQGIELRLASTDDVSVDVSPAELSRVLHNLLDNAIRHSPVGGLVLVESRLAGDHIEVAVLDRCGGIPADDIERVFDVAFRGDASRGRDGGGGLGLAIAKGLVEAHEGTIEVGNHREGCRFKVRLPVVA